MTPRTRPGHLLRVSERAAGILLVLVSACAFGSVALFVKPLYAAGLTVLVLLAWRFITASAVGWTYLLARRRTRASLRRVTRRRVGVLLLLGTLYVGNSYTYIGALEVVPIALNSIIAYLYPAIVAVMALRLVRRLEGRRAYGALALSLVGVALTLGGIPDGDAPPLWGLALSFANPVIYATWIVFQSRLAGDRPLPTVDAEDRDGEPPPAEALERGAADLIEMPPADAETATDIPDPAAAAALMTSATAVVFAILALASGASLSPADIPADAWPPLLGLGVIATAVAIQTFYAGVTRVGAARASVISTIEPVYTIALAMLLFGEVLEPLQVVGGVLVLVAVILAETGRTSRSAQPARPAVDTVSGVSVSREHA